jgi:UMF1 family MFS transporter
MGATSLMLIGAITPAAGILGAMLWPIAQRKIDMSNLHALVVLVCLASVIPAYGCLGFLPIFRGNPSVVGATALRFGGLTTPAEMYVLAVYFGRYSVAFAGHTVLILNTGSLYGAFQSYARAVYSELIPEAEAARWYVSRSIL